MNQKIKYALFGLLAIGLVTWVVKSGLTANLADSNSSKLKVTASFYPMAEFARQVGGDNVEVTTMVKPGVEPHDYDPAPQDLAALYSSKLLVYNGAGLEKWVDRIQSDLKDNDVATVVASDGIELKTIQGGEEAGAIDPHVWLDPVLAAREVDNIATSLEKVDPAHSGSYKTRAAAYKAKLSELGIAYREGLATCQRRDIVTSHQAFGYLGSRYNLDVLAISGLSPDQEPTPQQLAQVAQYAKEHNVKYIFFEALVSPKLSETIASEVGAKTLVFDPIEGVTPDEAKHGEDYISIQRENLNNLRVALDCK